MPRLVAVDALPGPAFVEALRRAWDAGDAIVPIDPRLPATATHELLDELQVGDSTEPGDALVVPTSGTTGDPKGVVLTHDALAAAAAASNAALAVDPATDRWLAKLPLAHIGGLGVVVRALLSATPVTFDATDPAATLTAAVPTQLEREDHGRFRAVLVGGSADWRTDRPANVVRTYGLTESCGGVVYDGGPLTGVEVRVDETGQVWLRSATLLRCYRDGTDPKDLDGWLPTGDDGDWDEATDRLVVYGRRGDVIVTGGEKVWPEPVEAIIARLPSVRDVAIVGRPDAEWGAVVTAVVVPHDATTVPKVEELRDAVRATLPPWCAPKAIELARHLPRTALGKLRRSAL